MNKILIIGGGSIGQRHLRNLLALGEKQVSLVEVNPARAKEIEQKYSIVTFPSLAAAMSAEKFSVVFVCSPSSLHVEQALEAAKTGCDVFIEKPLSHTTSGLKQLCKLVAKQQLVTMVGCNWKFYPSFQTMKSLIANGSIGKILSARCQSGQYLPDWHPWEDYRKGYSANKQLGGGILLDSHEFDYLTWFMGNKVTKLSCLAGKVSNLEISVEDVAEVILQFDSGALGEIHMDYLQRFYQRNFEFFGETGTLLWDINLAKVVLKSKQDGMVEFPLEPGYDLNTMYVEEIKHFLACVGSRKETVMPVKEGALVVQLILTAKQAAKQERVLKVHSL